MKIAPIDLGNSFLKFAQNFHIELMDLVSVIIFHWEYIVLFTNNFDWIQSLIHFKAEQANFAAKYGELVACKIWQANLWNESYVFQSLLGKSTKIRQL